MATNNTTPLPHEQFQVFSLPQRIVLQPVAKDGSRLSGTPALEFDRSSSAVSLVSQPNLPVSSGEEAFGLIGVIKLLAGNYLILITGRKLVGVVQGHKIWRITRTNLLPVSERGVERLDAQQQQDEKHYKRLLEGILEMEFYFAPTFDLTNTTQRSLALDADPAQKNKPLWTRADPRFFWNRALLKSLIDQGTEFSSWISPVMMGFIQIEADCKINNTTFNYAIISRRNLRRAGTRFFARGIDVEGNVANNVETEQIAWLNNGKLASFVETRGSIPVFWSQIPTLKYTPKIALSRHGKETELAFRRHFEEQLRLYGRHTLVNLVNQTGSEGVIAAAYAQHHGLLGSDDLKYIPFDFHHHCRGMKFENLSFLLKDIVEDIDTYGFLTVEGGAVTRQQKGTFRTNCVDNLDRTNVVQTMIAREVLGRQLAFLGVLSSPKEGFANQAAFNQLFKNVWANNADAISMQYSGTGALKNDFTRTGKRDFKGVLNDGVNSVTRYYLNNFRDGYRQDGFELFLGNYIVDSSHPSPFEPELGRGKDNTNRLILVGLVFAMMVVTSLFAPVGAHTGHKTVVLLFWLVALFVAWQLFLRYGKNLVNHPKLLKR